MTRVQMLLGALPVIGPTFLATGSNYSGRWLKTRVPQRGIASAV